MNRSSYILGRVIDRTYGIEVGDRVKFSDFYFASRTSGFNEEWRYMESIKGMRGIVIEVGVLPDQLVVEWSNAATMAGDAYKSIASFRTIYLQAI